MTSFEVVNEILKDGTVQSRIDVEFTKQLTNVQMVALYYKLNGEPDNTFKPLDFTVGESEISAIWKGKEDGDYNFRLVSISPVGIYSDISIVAGDQHYYGHPDVESFVTLEGDAEAPGTPIISTIQPILAGVSIYLDITGGFPDDFSHFIIKRKIGENIVTLDNNYPGQLFSDISYSEAYLARSYAVIAVDRTGNESEQSDWSIEVTPLQINTDDLAFGSITTDLITNFQIIGKDFRTSCDTGPTVDGVLFNFDGIQAWYDGVKTVEISASTGAFMAIKGTIGGWNIYETTISANNLVLNSDGSIHNAGFVAGTAGIILDESGLNLWNNSVNTFSLDSSTGTLFSILGTIGSWAVDETTISANNIVLDSTGAIENIDFATGVNGWSLSSDGGSEFNNTRIRGLVESVAFKSGEINGFSGINIFKPSTVLTEDFVMSFVPTIVESEYNHEIMLSVFQQYLDEISETLNLPRIQARSDELTYSEYVEQEREYYQTIFDILGEDAGDGLVLTVDSTAEFEIGDVVIIKRGLDELWASVTEIVGYQITFIPITGEITELHAGQPIIKSSSVNDMGGMYISGVDSYLKVYNTTPPDLTTLNSVVLIGNLNGWNLFENTYGIAIGSSAGQYLTYDDHSEVLHFKGVVDDGSTGIANFADAGALAVINDLDGVPDGVAYFKTNADEKTGSGRAFTAIDAFNFLITGVKPESNIGNPSASGLYVGADKMGYFDTCTLWKSYIDNSGNFYLVSNEDYLTFINNKINIAGSFVGYGELLDGYIGDLQITTEGINSQYADADGIYSLIIKGYRPEIRLKHEYYSTNYSCYSCSCNDLELELTEIILNPFNTGIDAENSPVRINVATNDRTALFTNGNIYAMGGFVTGTHLFSGTMDGSIDALAPLQIYMQNTTDYAINTNGVIVSANINEMSDCISSLKTRLNAIEQILGI
jgi:hypothetical protein